MSSAAYDRLLILLPEYHRKLSDLSSRETEEREALPGYKEAWDPSKTEAELKATMSQFHAALAEIRAWHQQEHDHINTLFQEKSLLASELSEAEVRAFLDTPLSLTDEESAATPEERTVCEQFTRRAKWSTLAASKNPAAVPPLLELLASQVAAKPPKRSPLRRTSLGEFILDVLYPPSRELPYMEWKLNVTTLARTLGCLGDSRAREPLSALLQIPDPDLQRIVQKALDRLKGNSQSDLARE